MAKLFSKWLSQFTLPLRYPQEAPNWATATACVQSCLQSLLTFPARLTPQPLWHRREPSPASAQLRSQAEATHPGPHRVRVPDLRSLREQQRPPLFPVSGL